MNRTTLVAGFGLLATASAAFANNSDALNVTAEPAFTIPVLADNHGMHIGARFDLDMNFISEDDDFTGFFDPDPLGPTPFAPDDNIGFRRARIMVSGGGTVGYRAVVDFAGGEVEFADLYMTLDNFLVGTLTAGQFFEPFGMESTTYSENISFTERSIASALSFGRRLGFKLSDYNDDMNFGWAVALTSGDDSFNGTGPASIEGNWALAGRVTFAPMMNEDGTQLVHVGLSYRQEHTGTDDAETGLGLEAATAMGALSLQAELINGSDLTGSAGNDGSGLYLQAAYMLTGETRSYGAGNFGAVTPNSNWNGFGGDGSGALELAARYSVLSDETTGSDDEASTIELGLNWYMNQGTRLMLGLGTTTVDNGTTDSSADFISLRWQLMV